MDRALRTGESLRTARAGPPEDDAVVEVEPVPSALEAEEDDVSRLDEATAVPVLLAEDGVASLPVQTQGLTVDRKRFHDVSPSARRRADRRGPARPGR
jgi:hypothetical protein